VSNGRFFVPELPGTNLILDESQSHYIADVLRLRLGDTLEIGDPASGSIGLCHISSLGTQVTVTLDTIRSATQPPYPPLTLLSALCKGQKNDQICDWATELGCSEIIFWEATRSVVRLKDSSECQNKEIRLTKIAHAAAQQSKQSRPPQVHVTRTLAEALQLIDTTALKPALRLVCSLSEKASTLPELLRDHPSHAAVVIVIGPEGDLTGEEESMLASHRFVQVSLGSSVLRSELAAVTAIATTRMLLGGFTSPQDSRSS